MNEWQLFPQKMYRYHILFKLVKTIDRVFDFCWYFLRTFLTFNFLSSFEAITLRWNDRFFLAVDIVNMTSVLFLNRNETIFLKLQTKHINGIHGSNVRSCVHSNYLTMRISLKSMQWFYFNDNHILCNVFRFSVLNTCFFLSSFSFKMKFCTMWDSFGD